ncbi:LysE family translocator [Aestuariibacter halophilus]|uniref:LysE family translocator n=1 Tax=Fluctibacter halophilus TaxID=226011 RepID=A0ABS8GBM7_9ALTE|nr:LysE family translocator [Aestuariibacter halophilus]MCC2617975.1 LysE family translocator [Aestuariibacter halophilus]
MPALDTWLAFALAAALLCISPGPSNLYIMARSLSQGYQAGTAAASGMALGSLTYVLATALGIAVIFTYSPLAYLVLKLAGAGYLIYLGVQYFRHGQAHHPEKPTVRWMTRPAIFRQSIVVELTNPKTALFFLAFLPQFVDPDQGAVMLQLFVLGITYTIIGLLSDLTVVMLSGTLGRWLSQHPRFSQWQDYTSGVMLLGLGMFILYQTVSEQPASN